jgi:NTP pyrophosphatase (non-canonical NTP hydrolase)
MTFDEYQLQAESTAIFNHAFYPAASLMIEAAELADLFCKPQLRGDDKVIDRGEVVAEAGDVLWNLAVLLKRNNIKLSEVAEYNIKKLKDRQARNVLMGDGGER